MNTGIEVADLNWAWNEKPLEENDAKEIRKLKKSYSDLKLPFWWWVYLSGKSKTTKEMLLKEGFSCRDAIPCMAVDLDSMQSKKQNAEDVEILFVQHAGELKLWEEISFAGFEMPVETGNQYNKFVKAFNLGKKSPQKLFLAYWKGKPVASALLFLQDDMAGLYFVSTLAEYRKRGIASALIRDAMRFAKSSGCKYCALQSSKEGIKVYLKAGFKEYCRAEVYCLRD